MRPGAWPDSTVRARKTQRPLAVLIRDRLGEWLGDDITRPPARRGQRPRRTRYAIQRPEAAAAGAWRRLAVALGGLPRSQSRKIRCFTSSGLSNPKTSTGHQARPQACPRSKVAAHRSAAPYCASGRALSCRRQGDPLEPVFGLSGAGQRRIHASGASLCDRSGSDRPAGDLRLPRPLRLGTLDRVDRGGVQGEPRIPAQIRALARIQHRAENQLAVLEDRLDPGDPRRPVGSQGGDCLMPVSVELGPHPLRERRLCPFNIPPRRHTPMITSIRQHGPGFG
jgi:hypothetical protein